MRSCSKFFTIVAIAGVTLAKPLQAAEIERIRLHLFYEETGRLSEDISPPREYIGWNTIIGEGEAEEIANDLLVAVEVRTVSKENVTQALQVVARGAKNRLIASRTFNDILTSEKGRAFKALLLRDVGCEGDVQVTATLGKSVKTTKLSLNCGE